MAARRLSSQMNKWNTLKVAMYGACVGLLYAASLEIGLWTHPDMYGQAGGGLIGGTIAGAILGLLISGFRNFFVRFFSWRPSRAFMVVRMVSRGHSHRFIPLRLQPLMHPPPALWAYAGDIGQ